jgi:hypothetical protein
MDTDKIKIFGARMKVDSTGTLAELERAERVCICQPMGKFISLTPPKQEKMKAKVEAIASHGISVFVNRQLVYNYPENLLAEKGVMSIEHADFEGVERLSLVTGGEITSTFDRPDLVKLGRCDLIEEIMIGEDKVSSSCVTKYRLLNRLLSSSSNSPALRRARRVQSYCAVQLIKWSTRPSVHYMTLSRCYRKPLRRRALFLVVDALRC